MNIRWEQRFSNYLKAFEKLSQSVSYIQLNTVEDIGNNGRSVVLLEMIQEGLIHKFEYTHALACDVMKDYAAYQGNPNITGSRDAVREAFKMQLIKDGETWMDMIESRNKTSHTYNEGTTNEIFGKILTEYYPVSLEFRSVMEEKRSENQKELF
jgi:nucleotidyltransferase substrate binding protein (TIGR01987 family)